MIYTEATMVCQRARKSGQGAGVATEARTNGTHAVICCLGDHATMEHTCSQEMLRILQRQNDFFPL